MDLYDGLVDREMATPAGEMCVWFVIRHRLLRRSNHEGLHYSDPPRAEELAKQRESALSERARETSTAEATAFVRSLMIERARAQISTTEVGTFPAGMFATGMFDGLGGGVWEQSSG